VPDYRQETESGNRSFRKEPGRENGNSSRSVRLQKGSERWIKIVRKEPGEHAGRNRRSARLQTERKVDTDS
jgi:hypothetical protein